MKSHFQSSEATWTRSGLTVTPSGLTVDTIGLRGLKSCEHTNATPPTRNTVMAGIDQTSVARITGITIASRMPSALSRICRSARAIGPFGSSTPSVQPPSAAAPIRTTASKLYRMLDLTHAEVDETACAANGTWQEIGMQRPDSAVSVRGVHERE